MSIPGWSSAIRESGEKTSRVNCQKSKDLGGVHEVNQVGRHYSTFSFKAFNVNTGSDSRSRDPSKAWEGESLLGGGERGGSFRCLG